MLGKAIDLKLDGDGKISEEEWAAAEMGENEWGSEKKLPKLKLRPKNP
jgi:hypothetical protein